MKIFFLFLFALEVIWAKPLVIAHRGASGHRPEHTFEAYQLAINMGADFIEPDLVMTKDGILVVRHENEISETTNVAVVFPNRKTSKVVDGERIKGWFVEDFTLAEMKTLKARQRVTRRPQQYNDLYSIPTFEEVIELAKKNRVGIYPEMKHPSYFEKIKPSGKSMIEEVARILKKHDYETMNDRVFVQSFELSSLKRLRELIKVPVIFLVGAKGRVAFDTKETSAPKKYLDYVRTKEDMIQLAKVVQGIGPQLAYLEDDKNFMTKAQEVGLLVHPYTFREGSSVNDYVKFYRLGVDGVFSDFPDQAIKARELQQRP